MPDLSAAPALSDADLRETLDLLGMIASNMVGKLDQPGETLAAVQKTALESRDAAQAAKAYADPQRYGRHIGNEIDKALSAPLARLERLQSGFVFDRQEPLLSLDELVLQEEAVLQHLRDDLEEAVRWKRRIPFIALFGLVLAIGLIIALPRFIASSSIGCAVLGVAWLRRPETGKEAGVFYAG